MRYDFNIDIGEEGGGGGGEGGDIMSEGRRIFRIVLTPTGFLIFVITFIRYSRACHNYANFSSRHSMLVEGLFNQGFFCEKTDDNILQIYG